MSECNRCTVVPFAVHESALARHERAYRRLWIICIILVIALVLTNLAWVIYESQFAPEVSEIYACQDGEGVNIVGGGNICYGTGCTDKDKAQSP